MTGYIGGEDFRRWMRHVPSPVMVLTYESQDGPRGVTIGSFASVSLKPPLISFNLMKDGSSADDMQQLPYFAIHILRNDQAKISEHFAQPDIASHEQFESMNYEYSKENVPVLKDCLAVMVCSLHDIISAGDHSLILGKVIHANVINPAKPLLYFQRSYHEVGDIL